LENIQSEVFNVSSDSLVDSIHPNQEALKALIIPAGGELVERRENGTQLFVRVCVAIEQEALPQLVGRFEFSRHLRRIGAGILARRSGAAGVLYTFFAAAAGLVLACCSWREDNA